jgi:hypothetical protein
MFRALDMFRKESDEGFQSPSHSEFVVEQSKLFTKNLPNAFPTYIPDGSQSSPGNSLKTAANDLAAYDPNTRQQTINRDVDLATFATSLEIKKEYIDANQRCSTTPLDILIGTENTSKKVRCGWVYQKGANGAYPAVSQGVLGTRAGPMRFFNNPKGTWFWSLDDAKKAILTDRCGALTDCKDAGAPQYANCAYSTTRGVGIPVNNNGGLLYPRDPRLTAPVRSLIREGSRCPPPPPPGSPAYDLLRSRDLCTPMPNGQLSRDCMLQQIEVAGCKREGSLYQSMINNAQPNNYGAGLESLLSYKKYQELAAPPALMEGAIRDGKITKDLALTTFRNLAKESGKVEQTALNFAARDLCLKSGTIDGFDFCSDLTDSSRGPFGLDCLQKAFLKAGGQPAGAIYPTQATKHLWTQFTTWKNVKDHMDFYALAIKSSDEGVQRTALSNFLGINREPPGFEQISKIVGIEVFWFNTRTNNFVGRRVSGPNNAQFPRIFSNDTNIANTGLDEYIEYYVLTNIRPPQTINIQLGFTTDDGMLIGKDVAVDGQTTKGMGFNDNERFGANWGQPPTSYTQGTCWKLRKNGPNYITAYWSQGHSIKYSDIYYRSCDQPSSFTQIPNNWMTMTQEIDAPMLSWEYMHSGGFRERRMPSQFPIAKKEVRETTISADMGNFKGAAFFQSRASFIAGLKFIETNSWRTLTLGFFTGGPYDNNGRRDGYSLLSTGPLYIAIDNASVIIKWETATLNITRRFENVLDTTGNRLNYICINMKSDFKNMYPNRLTCSVGSATNFLNGSININSRSNNNDTFTTENNAPLYNRTDGSFLGLGGIEFSAKFGLAFFRLFDYEMSNTDCIKDISNKWERGWIEQ